MKKSVTMSRLARRTLNVDESRIVGKTRRLSFSLGFLYEQKRVLDNFKITESELKNLQYLPAVDKLKFFRYYSEKSS